MRRGFVAQPEIGFVAGGELPGYDGTFLRCNANWNCTDREGNVHFPFTGRINFTILARSLMPVLHHILTPLFLFGILVILDGCKSSEAATDVEVTEALKGGATDTDTTRVGDVVTSEPVVAEMSESDWKQGTWRESPVRRAQVTQISPRSLYSGPNVLTVRNENGISSISIRSGASDVKWSAEGDGFFPDCPKEQEVTVSIETVTKQAQILLEVVDCNQNESAEWVQVQNRIWRLDEINFPDTRVGEKACKPFRIAAGSYEILDSVTFPPGLPLSFEERPAFPVEIRGGTFWYTVCFTGTTPGEYTFPVTTWMRRQEPAGGYTTYAVADTGRIRIIR